MRLASPALQKLPRLFTLMLSAGVFIPRSVEGQTSLSLQAGPSFATLAGGPFDDGSRTGFSVVASAILPFTTNLGLQLGTAYAARGATEAGYLAIDLDYVEIPLLLRVSPSVEGAISPHFTIGHALSFRLNCGVSVLGAEVVETRRRARRRYLGRRGVSVLVAEVAETTIECDEQFDDLDFGAMGGAGIDIAGSGSLSVSLDVVYNLGLTSIDWVDSTNRAFSILAGITFPIG